MFIQQCHVRTLNVYSVLDNVLLAVLIGLGAQCHKETQMTLVAHVKCSPKSTHVLFEESFDLIVRETVIQGRITVEVEIKIHEKRNHAVSRWPFHETIRLFALNEEMVVEFIQKCIVFHVGYTPGTFKSSHARKCSNFPIFFVGSMTAKKVIHTTHSPFFITPVCTLTICLDRGSIFRIAPFM